MKKLFLPFLLLLFLPFLGKAQTKAQKEVAAAVEQLSAAIISGNAAQLQAITSRQLTYGHSNGNIESQTAFVEVISSGKSDYVSINLTNQTITVSGKTAVVRHNLEAQTQSNGNPGVLRVGVLAVWQKEKGGWKLLARQGFKQ